MKRNKHLCHAYILLTVLIALVCIKSYGHDSIPSKGDIIVVAWRGIPQTELTKQRFIQLREAGFNATLYYMDHIASIKKALLLGKTTGVKILARSGEFATKTQEAVNAVKDSAALLCYFLDDEPSLSDFKTLGKLSTTIKTLDPDHPCCINLFQDCGTKRLGTNFNNYVKRAIKDMHLQLLSFDMYPVRKDGLDVKWYRNLEVMSAAAKKNHIPLWTFALSTPHSIYAEPSLDGLRLQVYSNLAYGAQVIQYFTYWAPPEKDFDYHNAPIQNGEATANYYLVKEMNSEMQKVAGVFKGATMKSLYHAGNNIPDGTAKLKALPKGFSSITSHGNHILVSQLQNDNQRYVVIQNCELYKNTPVDVYVTNGMRRVYKDGTMDNVSGKVSVSLTPGDVLIFDNTHASKATAANTMTSYTSNPPQRTFLIAMLLMILFICVDLRRLLRYGSQPN